MAKKNENPDEIVHLQVAEGSTAVYGGISYGSGATLQVRRGDFDRVDGKYEEVHPHATPDVAARR